MVANGRRNTVEQGQQRPWRQHIIMPSSSSDLHDALPCCAVLCCAVLSCAVQDQASQSLGTYTAVPDSGSIPAKGSKTVTLSLQAARLGRIQLPVYIRIAGSRNKPLQLVADAKAMGPWLEFAVKPKAVLATTPESGDVAGALLAGEVSLAATASAEGIDAGVSESAAAAASTAAAASVTLDGGSSSLSALHAEVSSASQLTSASGTKRRAGRKSKAAKEPVLPQWAAAASISFDKVQVLQPHTQQLLLRNPTLIDSEVKLFVEGRDSVFEVSCQVCATLWHHRAVVCMQATLPQ
jgi:hypothetical protein